MYGLKTILLQIRNHIVEGKTRWAVKFQDKNWRKQSVSKRFVDIIHTWPNLFKHKFFKRKRNVIQDTVLEQTITDKKQP